jgi:catalase
MRRVEASILAACETLAIARDLIKYSKAKVSSIRGQATECFLRFFSVADGFGILGIEKCNL